MYSRRRNFIWRVTQSCEVSELAGWDEESLPELDAGEEGRSSWPLGCEEASSAIVIEAFSGTARGSLERI